MLVQWSKISVDGFTFILSHTWGNQYHFLSPDISSVKLSFDSFCEQTFGLYPLAQFGTNLRLHSLGHFSAFPSNIIGPPLNLASADCCCRYFAGLTTDPSDRLAYHSYENTNQAHNKGEPSLCPQNAFWKPVNGTRYVLAEKDLWLSNNYLPGRCSECW